jgi:KDO2-lipid IV(A) lauroyltransferase
VTPRQRLEAGAAQAVRRLLRLLPRRGALALGAALGRLLGDLDRRHLAIGLDNLAHAFPHWDESRRLRTARDVYAHFGRVLFDVVWMHGRRPELIGRFSEVEGIEHVQAATAAGNGTLLVAAHFGNWEFHGIHHGRLFGGLGVVVRPLDNPALDRLLNEVRTAGGNVVFPKRHALGHIMRALREGRHVALLLDQNVQEKDGIFVDYFGRPAATTTVAAALAVKTGCALLTGYSHLLPDGRYRFVYQPPLHTQAGNREDEVARLTQALTSRIEACVRERPEQWLWIHRRWKTRPSAPPAEDPGAAPEPRPA